ncbi:tetratricopeptide repeat protein 21A [Elgaria multicarinata webbii]|uniref:tetratricopeptide repeat protein 21A n=1 Tax=Elgaria multicarinata webbii TaxID=159646 RepID=UPI002FCD32C6
MADVDPQALARILYYAQEKYFNHVIHVTNTELSKNVHDPVLLFFKGFGTLLLGRIQEGIALLENARKRHVDVSLCCLLGLIYAHKRCENVDSTAVLDFETKLKDMRKTAGSNALYYAGMFLWLMNRNDKAKEYVDKMLKVSNGAREGLVLKGWIYVTSDKQHAVKKSIKYLDEGIQDNTDIFGMMGKAKYFMAQQNYSGALGIVSQLVVSFPFFMPAIVTKMRLHLALQDWEQSVEESKRILSKEPNDIDGLQYMVVNHLTMTGNKSLALHFLREFIGALELKEPQRPEFHFQKMMVISRLSGKNQEILQEVYEFTRNSGSNLISTDARIANELGYQLILQGNWKEASVWYRKAIELDENTVDSLTGIIWCQVLGGKLEEAEQQLEFLKEVQQSIGKSSALAYLQAVIASRKNKNEQIATTLLNEAAELHFSALHGLPLSTEYYEKLNPMFLIAIVKEYLVFCPKQPRLPGQVLSSLLKQATILLNPLVKAAPGMIEPLFLMAQVKYLSGELETAQGTLQRCLELDPTSTDANLLMAQIHLSQGNIKECAHSLEIGVSYNFQLRDSPLYHFIKARALNKAGEYPEAIKVLKMLINLPQMKGEIKKGLGPHITTSEQVSIYLELAEALRLNGELHEATKIMQDTINEFSGTPEEIRVMVANVDLALSKGEVDLALTMLRNITPNQPYYTEVKEKMAQIYLQIRKDKRLYIGCYCELCENLPSPHTSLLLGDAYMNIQEPEKALEVFEAAQKKNPLDATVARKIGQAYVYTHQYNKAINYYEVALKMSEQDFLCHDLADLLLKLKKFGKAEKVLNQALDHDPVDDLPSMMKDAKNLMLLAKVYETTKREVVLETLNKAYDIQQRILKRVRVEQPELIPPQRQVALMICVQFAEFYRAEKEYEKAVKYYTEALSCIPTDSKIILELARLYLMQGDTDQCEHYCTLLLQDDDTSEIGTMMMANLMFRKEKYEQAISLYRNVLEKTPDNFSVMESLIDLLRRSGKLEEAVPFFELAKKKTTRTPLEPGYNYCMGLYCWHMMQPNQALKFFNKARKDSDWGQKALSYMIQICLNPDNEIVGGESFENQNTVDASDIKEKRESEQHGIRTAEKLLKEFYPHSQEGQNQVEMLQSYCLMATKERHNVEKALKVFTEMGQNERDNVPAILAMAQAYMILKHTAKARTQLKRLTKVNWSLTDAEELEKAWILLSDIYCTAGKYDLATEQVKRCLRYNKSCAKAYECLGFIAEKENAYKDAATNYELAWQYSHQANPAVGFKLAFNYLKDRRYVEAIDVCHEVLKACPDYPKIREEILEKAQAAIKP